MIHAPHAGTLVVRRESASVQPSDLPLSADVDPTVATNPVRAVPGDLRRVCVGHQCKTRKAPPRSAVTCWVLGVPVARMGGDDRLPR